MKNIKILAVIAAVFAFATASLGQVPAANTIRIPQSNGTRFINKDTLPTAQGLMGVSAGLAPVALTDAQVASQLGLGAAAYVGTSTGGNGVADSGKAALFGPSGELRAQPYIAVEALIGSNVTTISSTGIGFFNGTFTTNLSAAGITADHTVQLPNITGTLITTGDTGTVTNAMLAGSIAYSKLSLTGAILNADLAGSIDPAKITGTAAVLSGNAFTGANTATLTSLGTTPTAAHSLINTTAAAAGSQQVSPSFVWTGQGWKTNATAGSQQTDFRAYVLPVQGAANPTAKWVLQKSINGEAFADVLTALATSGSADTVLVIGSSNNALSITTAASTYVTYEVPTGSHRIRAGGADILHLAYNGIILPSTLFFAWSSGSSATTGYDTYIYRDAAASLQLGADVNGDAVDQALSAADGITGTDRSGGDLSLRSGTGTGAGAVSAIIFKTPASLGSGTTAQTSSERAKITSAGLSIGSGTAIVKSATYSFTITTENVAAGATTDVTITATGVAAGDTVAVSIPLQNTGICIAGIYPDTDIVTVRFYNADLVSAHDLIGPIKVRTFEE